MALSLETLALAKKFTAESLLGGGAVKGKNAVVQSITPVDGGNEVVFQWTLDDGTVQTGTMFVKDGADGKDGAGGGGDGNVSSAEIATIKILDRAEYDALPGKDATTLYFIKG